MKASLAAALLATTALAAPPAAQAAGTAISIPGKFFDPARVTIVAGDTVSWLNSDFTEHDVRATDGSFDSAHLQRFGFYTHRFDRVGPVPYLCTIHPFMTGQVDVAGALLHAPAGSVLAGLPLRLDGRAAAGATSVVLERELDDGSWHAVATIVPGPDGAFCLPDHPRRILVVPRGYRSRPERGRDRRRERGRRRARNGAPASAAPPSPSDNPPGGAPCAGHAPTLLTLALPVAPARARAAQRPRTHDLQAPHRRTRTHPRRAEPEPARAGARHQHAGATQGWKAGRGPAGRDRPPEEDGVG